jgi:hypothetical protein
MGLKPADSYFRGRGHLRPRPGEMSGTAWLSRPPAAEPDRAPGVHAGRSGNIAGNERASRFLQIPPCAGPADGEVAGIWVTGFTALMPDKP